MNSGLEKQSSIKNIKVHNTVEIGHQSKGKELPYFCFKRCVWGGTEPKGALPLSTLRILYHSATSPAHFLFF